MVRFRYDRAVLERFPTLWGGVALATGVSGGPTPPALADAFREEQRSVLARIGETPLSQLESLGAWRQVFRGFGVDPTQHRSAAEALLRRLTKKGEIPGVNRLVDLGNLVSIRYGLPVAVLDTREVRGAVTVGFAQGTEPFLELDSEEVRHPEPGEVVFVDDGGTVHARRWCWRQSAQSGARETTGEVLVTVEGHHAGAAADVAAAVEDLRALLGEFAGGDFRSALLSRDESEFAAD